MGVLVVLLGSYQDCPSLFVIFQLHKRMLGALGIEHCGRY